MNRIQWLPVLGLAGVVIFTSSAQAQQFQGRPYIGYTYPAGGQQGTTFRMRLGGQALEGVHDVHVSGTGVTVKVLEYHWQMSPQDSRLLSEQMSDLRRQRPRSPATTNLMAKIEYRLRNWVNQPACRSIASIAYVEVTIAPDAPPGERELRVITMRGASNPLVFHVGQEPEYSRKPMQTCRVQILGKEDLALRYRPAEEVEDRINIPCTVNGQIASREVNSYRFTARKGQRLVITTQARQLIPYIADAVPGWIQPVLVLYDAKGKELAYDDDYRFRPDPVILFEVPKDGEYVFAIHDSIYRGREDFVYRITIGELPFVTSIYAGRARRRSGSHQDERLEPRRRGVNAARQGHWRGRLSGRRQSERNRFQPHAIRTRHVAGNFREGGQRHSVARAEGDTARHHQRSH